MGMLLNLRMDGFILKIFKLQVLKGTGASQYKYQNNQAYPSSNKSSKGWVHPKCQIQGRQTKTCLKDRKQKDFYKLNISSR